MSYIDKADEDLMIFALRNNNETFLKYALAKDIFKEEYMKDKRIIEEFLDILQSDCKTELIFNCLIYADYSCWKED